MAVAAFGFTIATLGALIVSINLGLFGFVEGSSASFVSLSIVLESAACAGLLGWVGLVRFGR